MSYGLIPFGDLVYADPFIGELERIPITWINKCPEFNQWNTMMNTEEVWTTKQQTYNQWDTIINKGTQWKAINKQQDTWVNKSPSVINTTKCKE